MSDSTTHRYTCLTLNCLARAARNSEIRGKETTMYRPATSSAASPQATARIARRTGALYSGASFPVARAGFSELKNTAAAVIARTATRVSFIFMEGSRMANAAVTHTLAAMTFTYLGVSPAEGHRCSKG